MECKKRDEELKEKIREAKEPLGAFWHLNGRKSTGPDNIPPSNLKIYSEELAPLWQPIFQQPFDTNSVLSVWKMSHIVPVPKKPCLRECNVYPYCSNLCADKIIIKNHHIFAVPVTSEQTLISLPIGVGTALMMWLLCPSTLDTSAAHSLFICFQ